MIFHQKKEKKKKRKKNPLLLYATAKLGGMDLAYLKSLLKKKKKHAQGVIVTVQNTFMYTPLTKTPICQHSVKHAGFQGKKKSYKRVKQQLRKIAFFFSFLEDNQKSLFFFFFLFLTTREIPLIHTDIKAAQKDTGFSPTRNKETKCGHVVKLQRVFTVVQHVYKKNTIGKPHRTEVF